MLSMQHVLCTSLLFDMDTVYELVPYLIFPDAIRFYSGPRQYSHFEKSVGGMDVSWWRIPADVSAMTKESVQQSLKTDAHLVENIRPCAIGEDTSVLTFMKYNRHLPMRMYCGILCNLLQSVVRDDFVRTYMDCHNRYEDRFVFKNKILNGTECRNLINDVDQHSMYILAHDVYRHVGITADETWFREFVKPAMDAVYPADLSENAFSYMKYYPHVESWISQKDWSHLEEGPLPYFEYTKFHDRVWAVTKHLSSFFVE